MRCVLFYHSLVSDWNHGNAHFLRGIASELLSRGHHVMVYEPEDGWSFSNLIADQGREPVEEFRRRFPHLSSIRYDAASLDLDAALDGADVVIAHEWNSRRVIQLIGEHRKRSGRYRLYFHDTHHRAVTQPEAVGLEHLADYDGALVFGESLRERYAKNGWARRTWTWHEAADTRLFRPMEGDPAGELIWIGNWGDEERTEELNEFLLTPVRALRLRARVHGVRYPGRALDQLRDAGIDYGGWIPNFDVPKAFGRFQFTIHVPRRPYREMLPGIPTIRVFEALACGIPLICAPWQDREGLFTEGEDYLTARDSREMIQLAQELLADAGLRARLASHGRRTIEARHTCAQRVDELMEIVRQ